MAEKQLYILSLSLAGSTLKAVPFWWDDRGTEEAAIAKVVRHTGGEALTLEEKSAVLNDRADALVKVIPWRFADLVHVGDRGTTISIPFVLHEKSPAVITPRTVVGQVVIHENDIALQFDGYNTFDTVGKEAEPVVAEIWEDQLRLLVWSTTEQQDPTVIDMKIARKEVTFA